MEIAESPEELERIYVEFQKVMLLPWRSANSNRTAKFQSHWDARLEALARERDKIFSKLKKSRQDCSELRPTFHTLDKQIKRSVRNKKKGIRRQELNAMIQKSVPETQKWVKKYLRRSNTVAMQSLQRGSPLDLASFTRHMETKRDNIARIPTRNFVVTLGELETEENSGKVASWEFPTALSLLTKDWVGIVVMIELKLLTDCDTSMKTTTRICAAIAGITAIDERKYSERSIN